MTNQLDCRLHFYLHRLGIWLNFIWRLPYHLILHKQEYGHNRFFIICDCKYVFDFGYAGLDCTICFKWETRKIITNDSMGKV